MSIASQARTLSVEQLDREIRIARARHAGDDYIVELEVILAEKRGDARASDLSDDSPQHEGDV